MTGPPTPPPTNDIEIKDAAAVASSTSSAAPATQGPHDGHPDHYQANYPRIQHLASQGKWDELAHVAHILDLRAHGLDRSQTRLLIVVPLVLAYLIRDELPSAQIALERLPSNLRGISYIQELYELVKVSTRRQHAIVYARAESLLAQWGQDSQNPLSAVTTLLLPAFLDAFRIRTMNLLTKAYSSLPLNLAEKYLGLPKDNLLKAAETYGWTYDTASEILTPKPTSTSQPGPSRSESSSLAAFDFVATSVARLEI